MKKTQDDLISEEQSILDSLILEMDTALLNLDKRLTYHMLQKEKAKIKDLPEAYGMLVSAEHEKLVARQRMKELRKTRDELYETRIVLDVSDNYGQEREDIKIGLHTYLNGHRIFIMSWKMPLCRHYILDNTTSEYDGIVTDKYGNQHHTHYELLLKRQVEMFFDKVTNVTHIYPDVAEETEQIIADKFLQELLNRRSGQEFKNIVFSIQKKQGEIIQTPFKQNLIVQGCAGSGKSMIMLHRLPIILYDNPKNLDRNNLYIISPSIAYIQMANNMRMDLEIDDLKMGTLEQYYNYVLEKYRCSPEIYGTIKPFIKLNLHDLKYVYSDECVNDIKNDINMMIGKGKVDLEYGYQILKISDQNRNKTSSVPVELIRSELVKIQNVINANNEILKIYHRCFYDLYAKLEMLVRTIESRKELIERNIRKKISEEKNHINKLKNELNEIDNKEAHAIMYKNRLDAIKSAENKITDLEETMEIVELDKEYFIGIGNKMVIIRQLLSLFGSIKSERIYMNESEQYQILSNWNLIHDGYISTINEISQIEDPYREYADSIDSECKKIAPYFSKFCNYRAEYLPFNYLQKLLESVMFYSKCSEQGAHNIYLEIMKKLGQEPDTKGRLDALECSPYLYLQILYQFYGAPNGVKESLISIDEAQNIEPVELNLIKAINGNQVVFNLFGDVKQHIEGSKGIDDWKAFSEIAEFKKEDMKENYRNARQITNFCNKKFRNLNMQPINLDGTGVHGLKNKEDFESAFKGIFQKPQNVGLSCILVKDRIEAKAILEYAEMYKARIHDLTDTFAEIQKSKWNLMTVEQSKGLEFETVFAISGRMSDNEKYIAYTRALDELYVYDIEIELMLETSQTFAIEEQPKILRNERTRTKRVKRSSKETDLATMGLREFFENNGLKVIDDRNKSGYLWVIGKRDEIGSIVDMAIEKYNITGSYGSGKITGLMDGWFTKSKK